MSELEGRRYRIVVCNPERRRRHRRTKTGCLTCKTRRIKCDEQKPACKQCISSGWECEGYRPNTNNNAFQSGAHQTSSSSSPEALQLQPRVALPRSNEQELRSYNYFLNVTAPAIAGVFEVDFWLTYVPRTCHFDLAIWHAVVSLGAVHEMTSNRGNTAHNVSAFALKQFNTAIKHLIEPPVSRDCIEEKWRALVASIVFTYLCSLQGMNYESHIHLNAARNLIEELRGIQAPPNGTRGSSTKRRNKALAPVTQFNKASIPCDDLYSAVACLEVTAHMWNSKVSTSNLNLLSDANAYSTWRIYSAPSTPPIARTCEHGKCVPSRATPTNLNYAGKAVRSLLNGMTALSRQDAGQVARVVLGAQEDVLTTLIHRQQPFVRAFGELSAAIDMFVLDAFSECTCFGPHITANSLQKKAIDVLRMYHGTCYPLFLGSAIDESLPSETTAFWNPVKRLAIQRRDDLPLSSGTLDHVLLEAENTGSSPISLQSKSNVQEEALAAHFDQALTLAETILQDPTSPVRAENSSEFISMSSITQPLVVIAHIGGMTIKLRKRVIGMLRDYPQHDVFMDSTFAAALCELILDLDSPNEHGLTDISSETASSNKTYSASVTFTEAHKAQITIQTWDDWLANDPGREETLTW